MPVPPARKSCASSVAQTLLSVFSLPAPIFSQLLSLREVLGPLFPVWTRGSVEQVSCPFEGESLLHHPIELPLQYCQPHAQLVHSHPTGRPIIDNACGAVPLDRAGRPRPALVRNQAKPDQGVGLRARAPAPQDSPGHSLSPLRFTNGRTAMEGCEAALWVGRCAHSAAAAVRPSHRNAAKQIAASSAATPGDSQPGGAA
jgi:hypothetical protein